MSSTIPLPPREQLYNRYWSNKNTQTTPPLVGSRSPMGWWLALAPATLEFWVIRFPNERNQGKQEHPALKYRVPHGSQRTAFVIDTAVINNNKEKVLTSSALLHKKRSTPEGLRAIRKGRERDLLARIHNVGVVISGPFIKNLLHNHFITKKKLKKKTGDVNYEANFSFFFPLQVLRGAKHLLPMRRRWSSNRTRTSSAGTRRRPRLVSCTSE